MCARCRRARVGASDARVVCVTTAADADAWCAPCANDDDDDDDVHDDVRDDDGRRGDGADVAEAIDACVDGACFYDVVIVGAGVSGCAFARAYADAYADPDADAGPRAEGRHRYRQRSSSTTMLLIDPTNMAKDAIVTERLTRRAARFAVGASSLASFSARGCARARAAVVGHDAARRELTLDTGACVRYGALCVATGARPRRAVPESVDALEVRDVESVDALARRVTRANATTVVLVGNGAIALEIVDALCGVGVASTRAMEACELVWVMKHDALGDAMFDADAADFFGRILRARRRMKAARRATEDWTIYPNVVAGDEDDEDGRDAKRRMLGSSAGPDWTSRFRARCRDGGGEATATAATHRMKLTIIKNATIADAHKDGARNVITLSNGETLFADVVVSAAGVEPRCDWLDARDAPRSSIDGGILVDECMRTVGPYADSIYAVGDACSMEARSRSSDAPWFQMRLWSHAAQTGAFAAKVHAGVCDADAFGFNFELFTHVTQFFGLKVVLLGAYNAQKLDSEPAEDVTTYQRERVDEDNPSASTYVRVLLLRGKMKGAVLIGDTDLEETFENLIMDGVDLSRFGPALLDPEFDVEDFFD